MNRKNVIKELIVSFVVLPLMLYFLLYIGWLSRFRDAASCWIVAMAVNIGSKIYRSLRSK